MSEKFFHSQPNHDPAPRKNAHHADAAEEVQRTRKILEQKANGEQVEEDAEGASNAVMRGAALAVHIADGHFADGRAMPRCQGRNEAVQLAVERNLFQNVAAI